MGRTPSVTSIVKYTPVHTECIFMHVYVQPWYIKKGNVLPSSFTRGIYCFKMFESFKILLCSLSLNLHLLFVLAPPPPPPHPPPPSPSLSLLKMPPTVLLCSRCCCCCCSRCYSLSVLFLNKPNDHQLSCLNQMFERKLILFV